VDRLYREFGQLLRSARLKAKLTQDEVAERVGLKRTSITNIEKGRQHIPLHQLFVLATAVGTSPDRLLPDPKIADDVVLEAQAATLRAATDDEEDVAFAMAILSKSTKTGGRAK
jgi:transcriptional regulator with XRE-family HTH domain